MPHPLLLLLRAVCIIGSATALLVLLDFWFACLRLFRQTAVQQWWHQ